MVISPQTYDDFKTLAHDASSNNVYVLSGGGGSLDVWAFNWSHAIAVTWSGTKPSSFGTDFPNAVTLESGIIGVSG